MPRYPRGTYAGRGGPADDEPLTVPDLIGPDDDVFADRPRGRAWRQDDDLDLDAGDPLTPIRMDD